MNAKVERYRNIAESVGKKYGIDPNLILGIVDTESSGKPLATGIMTRYGKALGLGQIMPFNWRRYGSGRDWRDPVANLDVAGRLLFDQLRKNGGNERDAVNGYFGRGPSDGQMKTGDYINAVFNNAKKYGYGGANKAGNSDSSSMSSMYDIAFPNSTRSADSAANDNVSGGMYDMAKTAGLIS